MEIFQMKLATMEGINPINHGIIYCRDDGFISKTGGDETETNKIDPDWTPIEDFGMYILHPIDIEDFPPTGSDELFQIFMELVSGRE